MLGKMKYYYLGLNLLLLPILIKAASTAPTGTNVTTPNQITSVESFMKDVLDAILTLAAPIIILALVYVGFLFVKAEGEPGKLTEAKTALVYVLLGTVIVIGANAAFNIFYAAAQ